VARDWKGEVCGAFACRVDNLADSETAEALVAWKALDWAAHMGFKTIQLEGDALSVISKLQNPTGDLSDVGPYIETASQMFPTFQKMQVLHVKRYGNTVANCLAQHGLSLEQDMFWMEEAPMWLNPLLCTDCNCSLF